MKVSCLRSKYPHFNGTYLVSGRCNSIVAARKVYPTISTFDIKETIKVSKVAPLNFLNGPFSYWVFKLHIALLSFFTDTIIFAWDNLGVLLDNFFVQKDEASVCLNCEQRNFAFGRIVIFNVKNP